MTTKHHPATRRLAGAVAIVLACLCTALSAQADRYLTENFDYPVGNLYGQGNWLWYGSQDAAPVQVVDTALTLAGYQPTAAGKAARLGNTASGQDVMVKFADQPITSGAVYTAALINVKSVTQDNVYFLSYIAPSTTGVQDKKTNSEIGRLMAEASSDGKFKFKISRNSSTQLETTADEYELGKTYLVVFMYQLVEGTKNDIVKLWVNPADKAKEPAAAAQITDMSVHTSADANRLQAVELRQGSSTSKTGPQVIVDAMRIASSWADLFDQSGNEDPTLTVTPQVVYNVDAAPVGQATTYATYKVDYKNLPAATQVYLTGKNRDQYEVDLTQIPAGSGSATVTLTYKPTAIGKHTARINFESSVATLNTGFEATALAYDPQNLPTIAVTADHLDTFKCKAGETVTQTFTVTTANFPDYGKAAVTGTARGAFIINNATLLKSGTTTITVTFKPNEAGNYSDVITLSGVKAEPKTVALTGIALQGGTTPGAEGDTLPLPSENPRAMLVESFDNVTRNTAVKLDGWRNLALKGTRAWWGYEWTDDGNKAAKVTPYDSKIEAGAGTPCQMMLVTPPLDYKKAASQTFSFRVMGDFMTAGMADKLEVCYIEKNGNDMYVEPIDGIAIPATADLNKEWQSFDLHLENQNIADVFYIGFRFSSTRGADHVATYYIDDVKWGVPTTAVGEVATSKTATQVKYYNVAGMASDTPLDGLNIKVTTYTDGTRTVEKMMR